MLLFILIINNISTPVHLVTIQSRNYEATIRERIVAIQSGNYTTIQLDCSTIQLLLQHYLVAFHHYIAAHIQLFTCNFSTIQLNFSTIYLSIYYYLVVFQHYIAIIVQGWWARSPRSPGISDLTHLQTIFTLVSPTDHLAVHQ